LIEVNERGPMKYVVERYTKSQLARERKKLLKEKLLQEQNTALECLQVINKQLSLVAKQNESIIGYLEKLTNGPGGQVHYIELIEYRKTFGEILIDFVRGEKNGRSRLPDNSLVTYPYSKVFMIKITNDGPADISFQTNRHARYIKLRAGESDSVSENETFQLTELRIANNSNNTNANVRIVVYA
jgi:hypothetical protein